MPESKRKGGKKRNPGCCQGSFWTTKKDKRTVVRAVAKARRRLKLQTGENVKLTPSQWQHDVIMKAAREELARK